MSGWSVLVPISFPVCPYQTRSNRAHITGIICNAPKFQPQFYTLKYRSTSNHELWEIHHQNIERNHIKWTDRLTSVRLKIDATASAVRIWTNCNQHTPNMNNSQSLRLQKLADLEFRPFHPEEEKLKN